MTLLKRAETIGSVSNLITFPATIADQEYHILTIGESVNLDSLVNWEGDHPQNRLMYSSLIVYKAGLA